MKTICATLMMPRPARAVYCEDFVKENGVWRISRHRMAYRQMDGFYRDPIPPESWVPEDWEEPTY